MSVPVPPTRSLKSFSILTFDIYGTLIDWEDGILSALQPLLTRLPADHHLKSATYAEEKKIGFGKAFTAIESQLQRENPGMKYSELLTDSYLRFAKELGIADDEEVKNEAKTFGGSIGTWAAFPDTVEAMKRLKKYFKLAPLSNVDRASFQNTLDGPLQGVEFDAIYTAEQIGSYKPDLRNFDYLFEHVKQDFGLSKEDILHTAQSLTHDHVPAKEMGLTSAWIARGPGGKTGMGGDVDKLIGEGKVAFSWRFKSLGEMADAVEAEP
jgi:2-haloalkanoic acid dehalogenase type II